MKREKPQACVHAFKLLKNNGTRFSRAIVVKKRFLLSSQEQEGFSKTRVLEPCTVGLSQVSSASLGLRQVSFQMEGKRGRYMGG